MTDRPNIVYILRGFCRDDGCGRLIVKKAPLLRRGGPPDAVGGL